MRAKSVHGKLTSLIVMIMLGALLLWPEAWAAAARRHAIHALQPQTSAFITNQGQWADDSLRFALAGGGVSVGLTDSSLRFQISHGSKTQTDGARPDRHEFQARFAGARPVRPIGMDRSSQRFHFLSGERSQRRENVPAYEAVSYPELYPGIELRVMSRPRGIKYEFHAAPGADWKRIRMRYEGASGLRLRANGDLEITPAPGWEALVDEAPVIFQETETGRKIVAGRYRLIDENTVGFEVTGAYDPAKPLVLDPAMGWGSYFGGSQDDECRSVTRDPQGNLYLVGSASSYGWYSGVYHTDSPDYTSGYNNPAGFMVKMSPTGALLWSVFIGRVQEFADDVAVDAAGNIYIAGTTSTPDWTAGGYDTAFNSVDAFLIKISPYGQHLWSTYVGGSGVESGNRIALDSQGNVLMVGTTASGEWLRGGADATAKGRKDAFVAKVSPSGQLIWSIALGGPQDEVGEDIALDGQGNPCITGVTSSDGWTSGGYDTVKSANNDAFAAKVTSSGQVAWSTYLGGGSGANENHGYGIAVDAANDLYVAGTTRNPGWTSGGFDTSYNGQMDGFVAKLSSVGQHIWSTYLGGSGDEAVAAIALDGAGGAYVVGTMSNSSQLWVCGGFNISVASACDAFVARLSTAGEHLWSSYLGGSDDDYVYGVIPAGPGALFVVGKTKSYPWFSGGYDTSYSAGFDAFITKINQADRILSGTLSVTITPPEAAAAGAQWRRVGATTWLNSGAVETNVLTSKQDIEFKPLPGWVKPANQSVTIYQGSASTASGAYQAAGNIRVTILPPEAAADGAQWRRSGASAWLDSGATETDLLPGNYTLTFKNIPNWITPASQAVTIQAGETAQATAAYRLAPPALSWGTYLGGDGAEEAHGVAIDKDGNILVTGSIGSAGWASAGYDATQGGDLDAFIAKLAPDGRVLWSSYLGGANADDGQEVAVDDAGDAYVLGRTDSPGWTSGGYGADFHGVSDVFLVKLSASGEHRWSACLGGSDAELAGGLALDGAGAVYVAGATSSPGWVAGGFNTTLGGKKDGFLAKLATNGDLLWTTCLGGASDNDEARDVAVDSQRNVCVVGATASGAWLGGGFDTTFGGLADGFAFKLTAEGQPLWGAYLGGGGKDEADGVVIDGADNICITGHTYSSGWLSGGFDTTLNLGTADAYAIKLTSSGQAVWGTYLGGSSFDAGRAIACNAVGDLLIFGDTSSSGWVSGGWDTGYNSSNDAFAVRLSNSGQHIWSTYLGGSRNDSGYDIAVRGWDIVLAGATASSGWLTGGGDTSLGAAPLSDGYLVKVREISSNIPQGALGVTISPPGAVTDGAKWRLKGETSWRDSGTTATHLLDGPCQVEFNALTYWTAPPARTVEIKDQQTTAVTGQYVRKTGSLVVALTPPEAIAAGARWRCGGETLWRDSGTTATGVPTGSVKLEFLRLPDWVSAMKNAYATVTEGATTSLTQSYVHPTGTVGVYLYPSSAVQAGAQWRRVGETIWRNSGTYDASAPEGPYVIEFKPLPGWNTPADILTTVTAYGNASFTAYYPKGMGALRVTLSPPEAVAAGARWRRQGATAWLDSGATETGVTIGNVKVEFSRPAGWAHPALVPVAVNQNQLTSISVDFAPSQAELDWSTYLGGAVSDYGDAIGFDSAGNIYVAGCTASNGWITGELDSDYKGGYRDSFLAKLSATGDLLWNTYLGGDKDDHVSDLRLDPMGDIILAGYTDSAGWISGGYDTVLGKGQSSCYDGFVARFTPDGRHRWSTYLGGQWYDFANNLALDRSGNIYIVGSTESFDWIVGGMDTSYDLGDAFVTKLSTTGAHFWSVHVGGAKGESGYGIALDAMNNIYICGHTSSAGWVAGGYDTTYGVGGISSGDGFVAKLTPEGQTLWSTYMGGIESDGVRQIALDSQGACIVAGYTYSHGWVSGGYNATFNAGASANYSDGFAAKLTASGQHVWSTYLGGGVNDTCSALALDAEGNAYVGGDTSSQGWLLGEVDNEQGSFDDGYLIKLSRAGRPLWGTYVGGSDHNWVTDIAVNDQGEVYAVGTTNSINWVSGGFDTVFNGDYDGFVARLRDKRLPEPLGSLRVTISTPQALAGGARWRRLGEPDWLDSGAAETGVPVGNWPIEFTPVADWNSPTSLTLAVVKDQLTSASAVYTRQTGSLRVTLTPPEAVAAGAQWRRVGAETWHNSGEVETAILTGACEIEFKNVPDWTRPASRPVTILNAQTTTASAAYVRHTGSIQVTITPPAAAASGAQWRREGQAIWLDSGVIETGVPTGGYRVEFKPAPYWTAPVAQSVDVLLDRNVSLTTVYEPLGDLSVSITPPEAASAGAQWRRVGASAWMNSGTVESKLPPGDYVIEFKDLADWSKPQNVSVPVIQGQAASGSGAYIRHTGALQVTVAPPEAASAGAQWRRAGTTVWMDSGKTEENIPTGFYALEFKAVPNWSSPASNPVVIAYGQTTSVTCPYKRHLGSLQVTITPPEAAASGARWRLAGSPWLASGDTATSVPTGKTTIAFIPLPYWTAPTTRTAPILRDQTVTTSAAYGPLGDLAVVITPPEAATAGALWRRVGTAAWRDSGTTETMIAAQTYDIEFKAVSGWTKPTTVKAAVPQGRAATASAAYVRQTGSLCVTIAPTGAVTAGAKWRRVGSSTWQASGATEPNVPTGSCRIEFMPLKNWQAPANVLVQIASGQKTQTSGSYARNAVSGNTWMRY